MEYGFHIYFEGTILKNPELVPENMIHSVFRMGPEGRLSRYLKRTKKTNIRPGNYIVFTLRAVSFNKYCFRMSVHNTPPHFERGFPSGRPYIYESRKFSDFSQATDSVTETVIDLRKTFPNMLYFRVIYLSSKKYLRQYLLDYHKIQDTTSWIRSTIAQSAREPHVKLTEQSVDGKWSPYIKELYGRTYQHLTCDEIQFVLEKSFVPHKCITDITEDGWKMQFRIKDDKDEVKFDTREILVSDIHTFDSLYKFVRKANSAICQAQNYSVSNRTNSLGKQSLTN